MRRRPLAQRVGHLIAKAAGWRVVVLEPPPARCVVIGAPHTSSWDLALTLLLMLATGLRLRWVGKAALFRGPAGPLLRLLGGLPVEREKRSDFVAHMVAAFSGVDQQALAILPEGSRSRTGHWRTGFYYIALGARVPIVLGYADYRRKEVGLGPVLEPSGDIQADFATIRAFYAGVTGKNPALQGPIVIAAEQSGDGGRGAFVRGTRTDRS